MSISFSCDHRQLHSFQKFIFLLITLNWILCVHIVTIIKYTPVRRSKWALSSKMSNERIHIISLQPISDSLKPKSIHELHVRSLWIDMFPCNEGRVVWDCLNRMHLSCGLSRWSHFQLQPLFRCTEALAWAFGNHIVPVFNSQSSVNIAHSTWILWHETLKLHIKIFTYVEFVQYACILASY